MTVEEYRQRMMDAFHNADCDGLIALVVLPTEKEFEHLEWLLEKHYKAKPKTGHWIKGLHGFKCSKCRIVHLRTSIYCPSCGAKMVEPQESEE